MPVSFSRSVIIIVLVAAVTFATRLAPFALFPSGKKVPKAVKALGKMLPPAVIGMLVIYCLKGITPLSYPYGLPEIISAAVVAALHIFKRNNLLSIGTGTVLYMILVQYVFV